MGISSLKLLKYVLFFFNLLFWFCGCCILGFGVYLLMYNNFGVLFHNLPSLTLGNVLIIVGSIIMVVAFLGCMGSIKENKCLLMSLDNYVAEGLRHSIEHYNDTIAAWDSIQSFLQCCGIHNKSDWKDITPKSCPEGEVEGCYKKAQEWFHTNFLYIGIITICVCVIQVLGMSFALTLNCQIDKSSRVLGL
ncbi:leukocyte surface antigen CD53 isoform 3-T3 [Trichechus inunguis]|uniref:Tetraspanin n=1 Tax=Trichechus manatus latirostris TaxID=127582 RepID=A0A2Y9R5G9_TRIMA|nr:leukocyte surface antigen CD53 isoform X2 [Trichechus manatus latirostris]